MSPEQREIAPSKRRQSDFSWSSVFQKVGNEVVMIVQIIDLDLGRMSVTNDIEGVIDIIQDELLAKASAAGGEDIFMRDVAVMYRDSVNEWDEVVIGMNNHFLTFVPLPRDIPGKQLPATLAERWLARRADA